jgi:hypothetical protein
MVGPFSTGGILDGEEKYALSWRLEFYRRDLVVVARNLAGREPFVDVYEATRPSCLAVIGGLVAVPFFGAEPACDYTGREVLGSRGCRDVASWYHLSGLPFAPGPGYVQL